MLLPNCELVFIGLSSPLLVGIYQNSVLIKEISSNKPISEVVIEILSDISKQYKINRILYANGPGSFMGLKLTYVALRVFCDTTGCKFDAFSAFSLGEHIAIPARKNFCFVKENGEILLKSAQATQILLPYNLKTLQLENDTSPFYILDAV